jgi:hypothetical protein
MEAPMAKRLVLFFIAAILLAGGNSACKKGPAEKSEDRLSDKDWVAIDQSFTPRNFVEEFIKQDAQEKGLFPVYIKNYGKNPEILRRYRSSQFAGPKEAQLRLIFPGMDDWMLVGLKYENEKGFEVLRTILYIEVNGAWKVGDSGRLAEE